MPPNPASTTTGPGAHKRHKADERLQGPSRHCWDARAGRKAKLTKGHACSAWLKPGLDFSHVSFPGGVAVCVMDTSLRAGASSTFGLVSISALAVA